MLAGSLLLAPLALAPAAPARAFTVNPALKSITAGTIGGDPSFSGSLGFDFSLSKPYKVTALGFFDELEDGLLSYHMVGIFDAVTQNLLVSAILPKGTASLLKDGFRWISVPAQWLGAGDYVIAATTSGDPALFDPFQYDGTDPVTSPGVSLGDASLTLEGSGSVVAYPTINETLPYGFIGPNFASSVPGPLPLLGAASGFAWSRRLRSRVRSSQQGQS
jgi:hypothetical protein